MIEKKLDFLLKCVALILKVLVRHKNTQPGNDGHTIGIFTDAEINQMAEKIKQIQEILE
jgi:hypothetical protein